MKNILLPTDFSESSVNAIDYAVQLFRNEECTFYVLNTYQPVAIYTATTYGNNPQLDMDLGQLFQKKSESKIKALIETISSKYSNILHSYKGISSFNMLSVEIEEIVEDNQIDAIIMGTNGASGLKEVFIGSETMQVIKNATVPVIGVPAGATFKNLKDILFTTDYNIDQRQKGLALLKSIYNKQQSRLTFLNVYQGKSLTTTQAENKKALDNYFNRDAHLTQIAEDMKVLEAIEDFQISHKVDLLILVHNKHSFFENLLFEPVVQKTVHHSSVPFMILPPLENS